MTDRMYSLDYVSFGVPFQLSAESGPLLARLQQCTPFGAEVCDAANAGGKRFVLAGGRGDLPHRLRIDDEIVAESGALQSVLDQLTRDLMVHVADHAADRVFVHAGVVGWQGHALILPGRSFAGKTTLVAELVRAGATYYSDEYAVLDERGHVHAYARDLQMREVGREEQRPLPIAQLNGVAGKEALPVSRVVFAEYVAGGCWMPEPVSAGLAVLEMMRHSIPVQRTPARVMATLAKVTETATAVRSQRGDARNLAGILLAAMTASGSIA